jgi:hypothetical protein
LKYTKPVDERNLQTLKVASQACFPATMTNHETNNSMLVVRLAPIGACIFKFTVLFFEINKTGW